jgi:uncharacterized RDD family membrane protein YckC
MTNPYGQQPHGQQPGGFGQQGGFPNPQQPQQPYGQPSAGFGQQQPGQWQGQPQQPYGQPSGGFPQQPYGQPGGFPQQPFGGGYPGGGVPGQSVQLPGLGMVPLASMGKRFLARVIDGLIIGIPAGIIITVITLAMAPSAEEINSGSFDEGDSLGLIATVFISAGVLIVASVLYEVAMIATSGATVGKKVAGVKVVRMADGQLPGWGSAFGRWAIPYLCNLIPCVGGLIALLCWLSPFFDSVYRQGWHDKAAKTVVIATK